MPSIIVPKQSNPPLDDGSTDDEQLAVPRGFKLFNKTWWLFFSAVADAINKIIITPVGDALVSIMGVLVPGASQTTPNLKGDHLSIRMFGAKGDTRTFTAAATSGSGLITSTDANFTAEDIGKRIILYGCGASGRETRATAGAIGQASTNTATQIFAIDAQSALAVKFAGNCTGAAVTWQVFGSNSAVFAGEVSVHGPTALVVNDVSNSYVDAAPAYRYYRAKITSTAPGVPGTCYVTALATAYVFASTITAVSGVTSAAMAAPAGVTYGACYAVMGTDDTAAIQAAIDYAFSRVVGTTADGGINLYAPVGNYLFSSPIFQKNNVTLQGDSGGATIFYADGEAMPEDVPLWNITGTFASDGRIAFFTRLEDVRIDCGHVPGSIGVFCDALQENSGLYRATVIKWGKIGIQAGSSTDQYGCINWIIQDAWLYPSEIAFLDDDCRALKMDYALYTTLIRGTYIGQGGYICGHGEGIDVGHGLVNAVGQIHFESCDIGFHFNTGSGGVLSGVTCQSFVHTAVKLEGGNPTSVFSVSTAGKYSIDFTYQSVLLTDAFISEFHAAAIGQPAYFSQQLQMIGDPAGGPNIITLDTLNFAGEYQGGWLIVNSRSDGFPNFVKTSQNASTKAQFLRLAPRCLEVRIGNATNAQGTDPGTSYLKVDDIMGGAHVPRLYFSSAGGDGGMEFGNNLDVNRFRWRHGDTDQKDLTLQYSHDSGATWHDFAVFDANAVSATITGLTGVGTVSSVAATVPSFMTISGSPVTTSGTLAFGFQNIVANAVLAGPTSGGAATPTFRALVAADLPGAAGALTGFTPTMTASSGTVTIVASDCAWQAQVLNPKQALVRYTVEFTVSVTAAVVFMSLPVTPKSSVAQYSQCFAMSYQDSSLAPKTSWNAIEPAFSRVVMFLYSGNFVSGASHYVELNAVIEIA